MVSAFSVPKAKREAKIEQKPGPAQYNPESSPKVVKPSDPSFSFSREVKIEKMQSMPGPGMYEVNLNGVKDNHPRYTLGSKREELKAKYNIGPGEYEPLYNCAKDKSPAYTICGKEKDLSQNNEIGPGQYKVQSKFVEKGNGYLFQKEKRSNSLVEILPGPGSYTYDKYKVKKNPSYKIGERRSDPIKLNVPGPGQYDKYSPHSKIGGVMRRQFQNYEFKSKTPGPGSYESNYKKLRSLEPAYSLPQASRMSQLEEDLIGPGSYEHQKIPFSSIIVKKGYNFGSQSKLKSRINPYPGPGQYEGKPLKTEKAIKMGERLRQLRLDEIPGPGSYHSNQKWQKKSYTIGKGERNINAYTSQKKPGPGEYTYDKMDYSKKISFGKQIKQKIERDSRNPGPGEYSIKSTFADVPKYLMPQKN